MGDDERSGIRILDTPIPIKKSDYVQKMNGGQGVAFLVLVKSATLNHVFDKESGLEHS